MPTIFHSLSAGATHFQHEFNSIGQSSKATQTKYSEVSEDEKIDFVSKINVSHLTA